MSKEARPGLPYEEGLLTVVVARQWFRERFDPVADVVLDSVFRLERRDPDLVRQRNEWRELIHENAERDGALEGWMLDGRWVCVELYDAIWERLRRVRRAADWERAPLWLRMSLAHAVLYQAFMRCALLRTGDYLNAPVPPEPKLDFIDADSRPVILDFNDVPPVKSYGAAPGGPC